MKALTKAMSAILSDLQKRLPPLLEGLKPFDGYSIGFPIDPEKRLMCVRFASMSEDENTTLEFDLHAQFPGLLEEDVYRYIDAVNRYLDGFDPNIAGYVDRSYSILAHDNPRTGTIEIFWSVKMTYPKDDCD